MFEPLGARAARRRISSTVARGTGVGVKARMLRRVRNASDTEGRDAPESGGMVMGTLAQLR
ncbi:hypothetical protein GCM10007856_04130 [Azospirillum oryzae]|nr:hypothetical protein GCM10007856_04130 [Azospirillum oryzae]